jgi:hypothetical protein
MIFEKKSLLTILKTKKSAAYALRYLVFTQSVVSGSLHPVSGTNHANSNTFNGQALML